ncbi:hypothetical protein EHLJMEHL_01364 [Vreelandella titanicae]
MKARTVLATTAFFAIPSLSHAQDFSFADYVEAVERAHDLGVACHESADVNEMTPQCETFLNYYNNEYDEQITLLSEEMSERGSQFINDIGYDEFDRVSELDMQVEEMEVFAYDLQH